MSIVLFKTVAKSQCSAGTFGGGKVDGKSAGL